MYLLNPRLAADIFDNEYIIANLDTGLYYNVQGLAVSLINGLPFQEPQLEIQKLASAFPDQYTIIEQELTAVLKELCEQEIIIENTTIAPNASPVCIAPSEYILSKFNRYADMQDLLLLDPIHDVDEEGWMIQKENQ